MLKFREDIKDKYIWGLDINPLEYDEKRGIDRIRGSRHKYVYDKADKIIIRTAKECLRKKRQLLRTFASLYHCHTLRQTQIYLSSSKHWDVEKELPLTTVQKYMARVLKILGDEIHKRSELKENIETEIKNEYAKNSNK